MRDLKSLGGKPLCRFESGRPHQRFYLKDGLASALNAASDVMQPSRSVPGPMLAALFF